jgi:hypothetical protein
MTMMVLVFLGPKGFSSHWQFWWHQNGRAEATGRVVDAANNNRVNDRWRH